MIGLNNVRHVDASRPTVRGIQDLNPGFFAQERRDIPTVRFQSVITACLRESSRRAFDHAPVEKQIQAAIVLCRRLSADKKRDIGTFNSKRRGGQRAGGSVAFSCLAGRHPGSPGISYAELIKQSSGGRSRAERCPRRLPRSIAGPRKSPTTISSAPCACVQASVRIA